MTLQDLVEIAIQVVTALTAAHEKGIVHRDIKPENIMIRRDGFVKVLDFGIAKLTEKYSASELEAPTLKQIHTAEGIAIGTPTYMSPEQARRLKADGRTDIWSVGVLMYEAIAGRKPFVGDTVPDIINAVLEKTPAPLARYAAEVPEALEWIVSRALRKERNARYQTANEVLTDIRELRTKVELAKATASETPDRATSGTHATAASLKGAPPSTSSAEYVVNEIKRHKTIASVVVALLALVLAGVGYGIYKWTAKQSKPAFQSAKFTRLTTSGKASDAAISPDGKWVAHVKSDAGQQSLWLRQVATTSDTQIVPPSWQNYYGITFSKDGDYLYYVLGEPSHPATRALYQVSALGGASRKLIENGASPVTLSPDGMRLAFVRGSATQTALVVANADGSG